MRILWAYRRVGRLGEVPIQQLIVNAKPVPFSGPPTNQELGRLSPTPRM
jgi:hypothetical protein